MLRNYNQKQVISCLYLVSTDFGEDILGFSPTGIGARSIMSNTGMDWGLSRIPSPST